MNLNKATRLIWSQTRPTFETFKGLWCSDQHTLHKKTPTKWILKNLSQFYFKAHDLSRIDIIFLGGDFFDTLVDAADSDLRLAQHWIRKFLIKCKEHDIVVRVLEGTHLHDREQTETFETQCPDGLDLKWVKTLSIEYIERFNMNVMYVPDNMGHMSNEEIWNKAVETLAVNNLTQVDMIAFHGMWDYQAPPHIRHKFHNSEQWMSICKFVIMSGHVHIPSEYEIIRSSGSFDRLVHGEEHAKGAYYFEFNIDKEFFQMRFWENKNALPYITIKSTPEDTPEELTERILMRLKKEELPPYTRIRVSGKNASVIKGVVEFLKSDFDLFGWDIDNPDAKKKHTEELDFTEKEYESKTLTPENLSKETLNYIFEEQADSNNLVGGFTYDELFELMEEFT